MKMAATFDPYDKNSWYFGSMTRQVSQNLLMNEREGGVFLVRDSSSSLGDFVLSVKEDSKVSHYIIKKLKTNEGVKYEIGLNTFCDLPSLLAFYKLHYLDTTPLIRPVSKLEKVIAKYDFDGKDPDDLPFKKGDILTVISKDEELWWTVKNTAGKEGSIPVNYVQKYSEESNTICKPVVAEPQPSKCPSMAHIKLPAFVKVIQSLVPNAYDKTALKLEVGDIIKVTEVKFNGQWEGELNGQTGHFPFTHVDLDNIIETNGSGDVPNTSLDKTESSR